MNKKVIANAISAYFGLGVLLLLPSKNENINHPFVKKHARTATFIHLLMFLNYLVFVTYSFLGTITIYRFSLNHILASIIFLGLFGWLLYGISKASSGNDFGVRDIVSINKVDKIIGVENSNLDEQGTLTMILSLIPFLGFTVGGKFKSCKSLILENNIKLNLIATLTISLLFVYKNENLGLLLILVYTIFIAFYSILIITKKNLITINLEKIKTAGEIYIFVRSLIRYLKNYFSSKEFIQLNRLVELERVALAQIDEEDKKNLEKLTENKLPRYIVYVPYLNIISLIDINSKNRFHVINGLILTVLSTVLFLTGHNNYQPLILFPIFFGIGRIKDIEYKLPLLFDIYKVFSLIFSKIFNVGKTVKEKQKEVQEITFKIGE